MRNRESFTAWITKYALTSGIKCQTVERSREFPNMVSGTGDDRYSTYHKPDWHISETDALARAEHMRQRRLTSLRRSIDAMERLSFRANALSSVEGSKDDGNG